MKTLAPLVILAFLALNTGCEMHPASQTVPGYAEKMAAKEAKAEKKAETAETLDSNPPRFFASPTPAGH